MERQVIWSDGTGTALEHLQFAREGRSFTADGVVVGLLADGTPFRTHYALTCDDSWRLRQISIEYPGRSPLRLRSDGQGTWETALREPLPAFDGCLDIAISVTPFTRSLPIRRLDLAPGERHTVDVVRIDLPDLETRRTRHRYSRPAFGAPLYRFEDLDAGGMTMFSIDADGLVMDYGSAFRRIYPSPAHPQVDGPRYRQIAEIAEGQSPMDDTEPAPGAKERSR